MTNLQLFVQLITTTLPTLGVLTYLLLHRRQAIRADMDELNMRQQHRLQLRMVEAQRSESLSSIAQTLAPMLGPALERIVASVTKPESATLDDFGNEELFDELNHRLARDFRYAAPPHPPSECCPDVEADVEGMSWQPPHSPNPDEPETSPN